MFRSSAWSQNQPASGIKQAVAVDQGVVDGDDALVAVAGRGVLLEFVEATLVERLDVPRGIGEEPIEAGLVGGLGELAVDAEHGLPLGDHQAGEVLGEVPPLAFVGEEVAVLGQGVLHDLGKFDDSWHEQMLRLHLRQTKTGRNRSIFPIFTELIARLQNSSYQTPHQKKREIR